MWVYDGICQVVRIPDAVNVTARPHNVVEVIPKRQPEGTSNHCVLAKACLKALRFLKRKSCGIGFHLSAQPMAWVKRQPANRVTIMIIRDYVYFNRLYAIMYDYFGLYAIILIQKPKR
jgi:hypothetical protein